MHSDRVADILRFWFAAGNEPRWFGSDADFDAAIGARFSDLVDHALDGALDDWAIAGDGALALVLLLDQFPRNLFRGSPRAFAGDERARNVARKAIADRFDLERPRRERLFLYLPLGHSEHLADQEEAVRLAATLENEFYLKRAIAHRDVIARFGRFPHRNDILGRTSTPQERAFLQGSN